jgi:hypothetical protein
MISSQALSHSTTIPKTKGTLPLPFIQRRRIHGDFTDTKRLTQVAKRIRQSLEKRNIYQALSLMNKTGDITN